MNIQIHVPHKHENFVHKSSHTFKIKTKQEVDSRRPVTKGFLGRKMPSFMQTKSSANLTYTEGPWATWQAGTRPLRQARLCGQGAGNRPHQHGAPMEPQRPPCGGTSCTELKTQPSNSSVS